MKLNWQRIVENTITVIFGCIPAFALIGIISFVCIENKIQQQVAYEKNYEVRLEIIEEQQSDMEKQFSNILENLHKRKEKNGKP